MENQHSTQSELRHSFTNFAPISREDRMMSPAGNSVHPTPVHPQYLHQPRQQQQQSSLPGTPQHSSTHHSASSSPYHSSFPMNRINTSTEQQQQQHQSPAPYPHSMPPSRNSSHPASAPASGGYLDPTTYLNMSDVMGMGMEPLPMGGTMGGNMDMDLSILSAEEHGDLRILEERDRERIRRLQAAQQDQQMGGRRGDDLKGRGAGVGRGRKRAGSDDSGHDPTPVARGGPGGSSNRKQRGRPRLDTKDENAADRRRTQIRLAQRAYRLRKETTISSLRNRVNELETAIDGMQTTFLELHDSAMNCLSKNPDISNAGFGSNLKQLTEKFLGLAKEALGSSEGQETGDEDAEGESINEDDGNGGPRSKRRRSRDDGSPGSGGGGSGMQSGGGSGTVPSFGGYQVSYSRENGNNRGGSRSSYDNSGNSQNRSAGAGAAESGTSSRSNTMATNSFFSPGPYNREYEPFSSSSSQGACVGGPLQSSPSTSSAMLHLPNIPYKQEVPTGLDAFSYSFHETNFSRRLHRAGLEYAHLMLTSPNVDQYEVARLFAYTFCYASREDALESITKLLQMGTKDSLDLNEHPEIRQLPRKPLDYRESMQSYEAAQASGGMQEPRDKEEFNMREEANKMLIKLGIHQKYLRPDEVEQYITNLGILTSSVAAGTLVEGPGAQLMEMEVESEPSRQASPSLAQQPQTRGPRSPPQTPPTRTTDANQTQGGLTSATVMSVGYFQPQLTTRTLGDRINYQVRQFEKNHSPPAGVNEIDNVASNKVLEGVKKQVDLDMFIKQLIPRGVCLGRFPGFKKSDVEAAISLATVPVY